MLKKTSFYIYTDLECIIEKIDGSKNNPENSYITKAREHIPSNISTSTISSLEVQKVRAIYTEVKIVWYTLVNF